MANFIFNWAAAALAAATLDLNTGNYYAHLVTTAPNLAHSTVADLTLPTVSGYAAAALTGLSNNSTRWTFDSFSFPKYAFVTAPTGVVICRRSGAAPASTDGVICYSDFNNSIGQTITLSPGAYVVNLTFGSAGAINYSYRYQYSSGSYAVGTPVPTGLIYLIGTKNNTQTYANPFTTTTSQGSASNSIEWTDRAIGFVATFRMRYAFDFGNITVKPNNFGFAHRDPITKVVELWGAQSLSAFDATNIDNNSLWTQIGSVSNPIAGWNFIAVTNQNYWRYLKIKTSDNTATMSLQEIELYNSSALSPTVNFA